MDKFKQIDQLEARVETLAEKLDTMTVGTEEYERANRDYCECWKVLNTAYDNLAKETDMCERREEQVRINTEELSIKQTQLVNDIDRKTIDMQNRREQNKIDKWTLIGNIVMSTIQMSLSGALTREVFVNERNGWMQPRPVETKYIPQLKPIKLK